MPRTARLYDFAAERAARTIDQTAELATMDTLDCLKCGRGVRPHFIDARGATHYRCTGPGHRPRGWRIDVDGDMMHGLNGNRYYRD